MEFDFNRYQPQQAFLSEEDLIHSILGYVATELPSQNQLMPFDPSWVCSQANLDNFLNLTMHRMTSEGLLASERSRHSPVGYVIRATPHGVRVAQGAGGYLGYVRAQRQAVARDNQRLSETEHLNKEAARATISAAASASVSATASERAVRASIIGAAVASLIALASIWVQVASASSAAAELAVAKEAIKALQQRVDTLEKQRPLPPAITSKDQSAEAGRGIK